MTFSFIFLVWGPQLVALGAYFCFYALESFLAVFRKLYEVQRVESRLATGKATLSRSQVEFFVSIYSYYKGKNAY